MALAERFLREARASSAIDHPGVIDVMDADRDEDGIRKKGECLILMVNPRISMRSKEMFRWEEGCLSVPEFWEYFERPRYVTIEHRDPYGGKHSFDVSDYPGIIVQHELDHLEGITLLDRVSRLKKTRYLKRVKKIRRDAEEHAEYW